MIERPSPAAPVEPLLRVERTGPPATARVGEVTVQPLADPLILAAAGRVWPTLAATVTPQEARGWGTRSTAGEPVRTAAAGRLDALAGSPLVAPDQAHIAVAPTRGVDRSGRSTAERVARPERWSSASADGAEMASSGLAQQSFASPPAGPLEAEPILPSTSPLLPAPGDWPGLAPRLAAAQDAGLTMTALIG